MDFLSFKKKKNSPSQLQQYVNHELHLECSIQAAFRKGRGTGYLISIIHWIIK